jgi:dolichyl-phosphate-mannose--protein O-mannosyl transferase
MLLLAAVAAATRLWRISEPRGIVFDELHFGKFVQWTLDSWYYFDIHPPLAKQTLALLGWLWGYDHKKCDYEPPAGASRMYADDCEFWKLRVIVALFSVGACVLMYPIARRFGASPAGAMLAASFEIFSIMHNVEGRLVLLNTQLLFWLNATLYAGQRWFARANRGPMDLKERLAWAVGVGVLAGNAFSVKHTGLGTPAMIGLEGALGLFFLRRPLPALDLIVYVVSLMSTYTVYFVFHFMRMKFSHLTLHQEEEFMTPEFQSLLPGSKTYNPEAKWTEGFWQTYYTLNRRMVVHSNAITQPHNWGTRPFDWLVNSRGVSYWGSTNGVENELSTTVYLFGNPLGQLLVLVAIASLALLYFVQLRTKHYKRGKVVLDIFRDMWLPLTPAASFCALGT